MMQTHSPQNEPNKFSICGDPQNKTGADLLFQVFSQRYETGSTIVTTN